MADAERAELVEYQMKAVSTIYLVLSMQEGPSRGCTICELVLFLEGLLGAFLPLRTMRSKGSRVPHS